jgi:xylan 1,4-beta-xylosidase
VSLAISGLPASLQSARLTHERIDQNHSNPYAEWLRMGSPIAPDPKQYEALEQSSNLAALAASPASVTVARGQAKINFALPRQAVSLLILEWN